MIRGENRQHDAMKQNKRIEKKRRYYNIKEEAAK